MASFYDRPSSAGLSFGDTVQIGPMGRHVGVWNEMHFAFQVLPRLTIGAGANIFLGPTQHVRTHGGPRELSAFYGGLRGAVAIVHRKRLDFGVDGYIGGGELCLATISDEDGKSHCAETVPMLVTEPRVYVNVKVGYIGRLGLAAGYRFVSRRKIGSGDDIQLSGPFLATVFEFGGWW